MSALTVDDVAARAGVEPSSVEQLIALGILAGLSHGPGRDGYRAGDVRRVRTVQTLGRAGMPIEGIAEAIRAKRASPAFPDEQ